MNRIPLDARHHVRNVGILAHIDAGKTTVTERMLYLTGATHRRGEVHDGTTVTDFDPEERRRGLTIFATAVSCRWAGHRITLIDTPGHVDFSVEVERSLRVLDGAVAVLDAVAGVEPQTEAVWRLADTYRVPRIAFVNKLDRPGADLDTTVSSIRRRLGVTPLVVQLPIGRESGFTGVVDLVHRRALTWADGDDEMRVGPIPPELLEAASRRRRELEEAVAERHPQALEAFCAPPGDRWDAGPDGRGGIAAVLPDELLTTALRDLVRRGEGLVVLCGAAYRNRGIEPLLDAVCDYLPSPLDVGAAPGSWQGRPVECPADPSAPVAALVFKVVSTATGRLSFVRVYAGTLEKGATVVDAGRERTERVGRILDVQADRHREVPRAVAGDVVALVGLKAARTGTTLCAPASPVLLAPPAVPSPVMSVAVEPKVPGDSGRLAEALDQLAGDDPSLVVRTDPETGQTLLSGLGELHLEVTVERLRRDHGLTVSVGRPQVAYRETVGSGEQGVTYRHVKQDGGAGQFAVVTLDVEPLAAVDGGGAVDGGVLVFESTVTGGRVPREYVRAVEAGCRDALVEGPLGGYPVTGVRVRLTDGATHPQDSSELAFRIAGRAALSAALRRVRMRLLEPVVLLTVTTPEESVGAVLGDLGGRRARVVGSETAGGAVRVSASVPLGELFGYASVLRGRTHGRATFVTRPRGYALVPENVARRVLGG